MTSPEHTLVGIHFALAVGLHRIVGWRGVVMAGLASNIPDWDGLTILFSMQHFDHGHRVWGHGILSIVLTSILLSVLVVRWDWIGSIARMLPRKMLNESFDATRRETKWTVGVSGILTFTAICVCAQVLHWPCDMVVSGGNGLSDWSIQPWWPFSNAAYVFPLIPWGDVGPTVILMIGIIGIAKRTDQLTLIARLTIVALCVYLVARGWSRGAFIA